MIMHYGMMGGFGLIGLLLNALVLAGIVVLVVWAVSRFSGTTNVPPASQSAREILQTRYARGEITREQYQQMLSDIS